MLDLLDSNLPIYKESSVVEGIKKLRMATNRTSIKIKTNLNQILSFEQGEVLVRLHLRKINDGL